MSDPDAAPAWLRRACEQLELPPDQHRRLLEQLQFLVELDQAKSILRRTYLMDGSRREDTAEHLWHAAMAAMLLAEHSDQPVDPSKLVAMLLVHDVVEIDAGDTFVYDADANADKAEREQRAAERLFGLLPGEQGARLRALWEEHEQRQTPEARMAAAIDRLLPIMANRATGGRAWREHGISSSQVREVNAHVGEGSTALHQVVMGLITGAVDDGDLTD